MARGGGEGALAQDDRRRCAAPVGRGAGTLLVRGTMRKSPAGEIPCGAVFAASRSYNPEDRWVPNPPGSRPSMRAIFQWRCSFFSARLALNAAPPSMSCSNTQSA